MMSDEMIFILVWLVIGHGLKELFYRVKHPLAGFPLIPVIWPIIFIMYLCNGRMDTDV
jgi:hypothetical protein